MSWRKSTNISESSTQPWKPAPGLANLGWRLIIFSSSRAAFGAINCFYCRPIAPLKKYRKIKQRKVFVLAPIYSEGLARRKVAQRRAGKSGSTALLGGVWMCMCVCVHRIRFALSSSFFLLCWTIALFLESKCYSASRFWISGKAMGLQADGSADSKLQSRLLRSSHLSQKVMSYRQCPATAFHHQ